MPRSERNINIIMVFSRGKISRDYRLSTKRVSRVKYTFRKSENMTSKSSYISFAQNLLHFQQKGKLGGGIYLKKWWNQICISNLFDSHMRAISALSRNFFFFFFGGFLRRLPLGCGTLFLHLQWLQEFEMFESQGCHVTPIPLAIKTGYVISAIFHRKKEK